MMYLGENAVGIATKIPVGEIYQSIVTQPESSATIIFEVENKPDAFIIGMMDESGTTPSGFYGCTAACGIWTEYQGGQYVGGRATGRLSTGNEDHWQIASNNIIYNSINNTFTVTTGSPIWFTGGRTYRLSYYTSHRGGDT